MSFGIVWDTGPYKEESNFLMRTSLSFSFFVFVTRAMTKAPAGWGDGGGRLIVGTDVPNGSPPPSGGTGGGVDEK